MKKWQILLFGLIFLISLISFLGNQYLNSGSLNPDNTVWEAYIGRDTTLGILPDVYANYFTYTLVRTNKNIGFKIQGAFPNARYMSFNVYNLKDNTTQGSLVDYQMQTDSGKPNPFIANKDSVDTGKSYTAYLLPESYKSLSSSNKLVFNNDVRFLLIVIRLYDYDIDNFGGVAYPSVQALAMGNKKEAIALQPVALPRSLNLRPIVRRFSLPGMIKRMSHLFETEHSIQLDGAKSGKKYYSIPFHGVDASGYIENNDNRYLMAAITKKEKEVYAFRFKAPSYTTGAENINQTGVRYWSFNLGSAATYTFNALKDEDAKIDEKNYVTIILADKDAELENKVANLGYNFLEWNMSSNKGFVLFRHMLAHPNFEAQIGNVPPFKQGMKNFTGIEAQNFMGDYAPQGIRMTKADFLWHGLNL